MKSNQPTFFKKAGQALLVTLSVAATFHLAIATITALYKHSISYVNPLDFLGLSVVFPQYRQSLPAAAAGWAILVALFFTILYVSLHYHLYVSIIKESKVVKRISAVSQKVQSNMQLDRVAVLAAKQHRKQRER